MCHIYSCVTCGHVAPASQRTTTSNPTPIHRTTDKCYHHVHTSHAWPNVIVVELKSLGSIICPCNLTIWIIVELLELVDGAVVTILHKSRVLYPHRVALSQLLPILLTLCISCPPPYHATDNRTMAFGWFCRDRIFHKMEGF